MQFSMIYRLLSVISLSFVVSTALPQATCTISATSTWATATCSETLMSPVSGNTIVVPVGVVLTIVNPTPTPVHTGNLIIFGSVVNDKANARWDGDITIKGTGQLVLNQQFDMGPNTGCGYKLIIETGGKLILSGSGGSDLLRICGNKMAQSGGACNSCGGTNSGTCPYNGQPYCEPAGGFTGPLGFDEGGALPVSLIFFKGKSDKNNVLLEWATSSEKDFDHFVVQHAVNGFDFSDLTHIAGAGYNTESRNDYGHTHTLPLIGANYYRLKAVDLNGSFEYFGPVVVRYAGNRDFWVHPNPASSRQVEFQTNFIPNEGDRVQVYNQLGLMVSDLPIKGHNGSITFDEPLRPGSYILKYVARNEARFARFVVLK